MPGNNQPGASYQTKRIAVPKACHGCGETAILVYDALSQMMVCRTCEHRAGTVRKSDTYRKATKWLGVTDR